MAILINPTKSPLFTIEERLEMARAVFKSQPGVEVDTFDGLLVDYARQRQALVDYARKQRAAKRGGQAHRTSLDASVLFKEGTAVEMLDLDKALTQLSETDPRLNQVVELRVFGGLSEGETAEVLGLSARTVRRDWFKAKLYLYLALREENHKDKA